MNKRKEFIHELNDLFLKYDPITYGFLTEKPLQYVIEKRWGTDEEDEIIIIRGLKYIISNLSFAQIAKIVSDVLSR